MSFDCDELHECADLLHQAAEVTMTDAQRAGVHHPGYVGEMRRVVALEEAAELVEGRIAEDC